MLNLIERPRCALETSNKAKLEKNIWAKVSDYLGDIIWVQTK